MCDVSHDQRHTVGVGLIIVVVLERIRARLLCCLSLAKLFHAGQLGFVISKINTIWERHQCCNATIVCYNICGAREGIEPKAVEDEEFALGAIRYGCAEQILVYGTWLCTTRSMIAGIVYWQYSDGKQGMQQ